MARVILGVSAGIAAYKSASLLRLLREAGHRVRVIPTADALRFVGEPTWAALSGEPVATDVWTAVDEVAHVRLGQSADLVIVAPATADLLARAAAGMSGDLLTATLLTARCPVVLAPAMHTEMWEHPATTANVALLRQRGAIVIDPASGRLTGADTGPGRLPEPEELFAVVQALLARPVPAGGTVPAGDRARGRLAGGQARGDLGRRDARGTGPGPLPGELVDRQAGVRARALGGAARRPGDRGRRERGTARPGRRAGGARGLGAGHARRDARRGGIADAVVMTAAVADFRPVARSDSKIKKDGGQPAPIALTENPDILHDLAGRRARLGLAGQVVVGFAAETDPDPQAARAKLARKGCDLLVVNPVGNGRGFGSADNEAIVYTRRIADADPARQQGSTRRGRLGPRRRPPPVRRAKVAATCAIVVSAC